MIWRIRYVLAACWFARTLNRNLIRCFWAWSGEHDHGEVDPDDAAWDDLQYAAW